MAVVEKNKTVQILYKVQTGATSAGKPSYSTRTVSDINPTITAETLLILERLLQAYKNIQ